MRRDADTWFAYAAQAVFGFVLYGSGAMTALLRADHGLSYAAAGTLPALFTGGAVGGALLAGWLLREHAGAPAREVAVLRGASAGVAVGMTLIALPGLAAARTGFALAGLAGGLIPPVGAVLLSRRHGDLVGRALLEVNVIGAAAGVAASGVLGVVAAAGSWRLGLVLPVIAAASLAAAARSGAEPAVPARGRPIVAVPPRRSSLPPSARWYIVVAVFAGALEFAVVYWAADLVVSTTGARTPVAAGALVAFTGGLVVGRAGSSLLARSTRANRHLLAAALGVAAVGTGGLLFAGVLPAAVIALGVTGLGIAPLYPLALALAVRAGGRAAGRASAALSVSVGMSAFVTPVVLAAAAEAAGMRAAFTGVPVLALLGLVAARRALTSARAQAVEAGAGAPGAPSRSVA